MNTFPEASGFETLANLFLKSAALFAVAAMAHLIAGRKSAALRHWIWLLFMASLISLPIFSRLLPSWSLPESPLEPFSIPARERPDREIAPSAEFPTMDSASGSNPLWLPKENGAASIAQRDWSWLVGPLWLGGFFLAFARMLYGMASAHRTSRRAKLPPEEWTTLAGEVARGLQIRRKVRVLQSPEVQVPATVGVLKPVILVPEAANGWAQDQRRIVLLHELAHVRRLDVAAEQVARLACALFWFSPLVWLARRRMALAREQACDDLVLLGGVKPSAYATSLLEVVRWSQAERRTIPSALSMASASQLGKRVSQILAEDAPRFPLSMGSRVGTGCVAIVLLAGIACWRSSGAAEEAANSRIGQLFFVKGEWGNTRNHSIWILSQPGATNQTEKQMAAAISDRGEDAPSFSPDRQHVAFGARAPNGWAILIRNLNTGEERELPTGLAECDSPAWSPDGRSIAFVAWFNNRSSSHIFVIHPDGTNLKQLTSGEDYNWSPSWAPNSRRIVWEVETEQSNEHREIYVMDADGTNKRNLTQHLGVDHHPAWSPDGKRIAFMSRRETNNAEIYVMDADGGNMVNLTQHPDRDSEPSWSPDGRWIAFTRSRDGSIAEPHSMNIFIMKQDGSDQTQVTHLPPGVSAWNPEWR